MVWSDVVNDNDVALGDGLDNNCGDVSDSIHPDNSQLMMMMMKTMKKN